MVSLVHGLELFTEFFFYPYGRNEWEKYFQNQDWQKWTVIIALIHKVVNFMSCMSCMNCMSINDTLILIIVEELCASKHQTVP